MRKNVSLSPVKHPRYTWRVRFPDNDGKTFTKWFINKTDAAIFAKDRRKEIGREGSKFGFISDDEKAAVQYWRGFVAGVPDAEPPALLAILQEYAERWKATRSSVTVQTAVDAFEVAKKSEGLRPLSLQGIRSRCARFTKDFGPRLICSITTAEVSDWILSLESLRQRGPIKPKPTKDGKPPQVGLLAKRGQRVVLSNLFNYAKTRGWVQENPVTDSARPKPKKSRPEILRPNEAARFFGALESTSPALVPFWALRFFAGIRDQECLRMDWSMIDLKAGEIHLPETIAKTGHSRTVKIKPVLKAFLTPYVKTDGSIVTASAMARRYHLKKALKKLQAEDAEALALALEAGEEAPRAFPVPMPANAARHSFATFHLIGFRHAGETAIQLGHGGSPEMLHRHYKGIASEAEALAFWKIRPAADVAANVISIDKGKKKSRAKKSGSSKAKSKAARG